MADFQARVRSRMDEEAEKGAVFFCDLVETLRRELKLTPKGDLVYIVRAYTGAEDMEETRAYKLTGIDSWKLTDRELTMSGEFMYDHDDHLWGVRDNLSGPVHRKIRVPQPLDNTDVLEEFLGSMAGLSGKRASDEGIGSMFVQKEILEPMAGIGLATVASPIWIASVLLYTKVDGTLDGFEVIEGKHYPRFSFMDRDGISHSSVDLRHPLENVYDEATIMRIVGGELPRRVPVRYRRDNREDCYCEI